MEIARVLGQCSLISARPLTLWATVCYSEINLDLTKCQGTGPIGSLYRGFVILKTSLERICWKTTKVFVISAYS